MDFVPREILNEILDYLPLTERIQCRRVCKKWNNITPSFKIDQPLLVKEKLFELLGLRILSSLTPPIYGYRLHMYIHSHEFEIRYSETEITNFQKNSDLITKVRLTLDHQTNIRREIYRDTDFLFSEYDNIDGVSHKEGIRKAFCNLRDLIKITNMDSHRKLYYNDKVIFDRNHDLSKMFYDPMWITNTTLEKIFILTEEKDYWWFVERWNENHNCIFEMLKDKFSKTKRQEELSKLIWSYLMF